MTPNGERWYWSTEHIIRVQEFFGPAWELPFRIVTLLSDSGVILIMVAVLFWILGRRVAYTALAAVMAAAVIGTAIKIGADIPRPEHVNLIAYETGSSPAFPSGHTMLAIAFWGTLVYLGVIRAVTAGAIVLVVMLSRLYLGVHYLADLIAGIGVGLVAVAIAYGVWNHLFSRLTRQQASLLIAAGLFGSVIMIPVAGTFPLGWEILGGTLGAGTATLIETRYIRYEPRQVGWSWQFSRIAIGGAGVLVFVAIGSMLSDAGVFPRAALFFAAGLWVLLFVPYILDRLGHTDSAQRQVPETRPAIRA
jgi:membrane-associated phospholipid phosphatase